ncbi:MAG: ImmA/IrrE family metallo-endopeptidase [Spirochaetia bacterium]|nr:ImmA/IrrE family metallo-endopeptidase [Spirochaetia bacterium]
MTDLLLIPTGYIIKDFLDQNNITQKDLAISTGMSEKHISNVLKGKKKLTFDFALKLEKVLPNIKADYWMNYETKYQLDLLRQSEKYSLENQNLKELSKRFKFNEIFKEMKLDLVTQAIEMLKLLKISSFDLFESKYGKLNINFMEDGGTKEAIAIWLNLCEDEIEFQNDDISEIKYTKEKLINNIDKLKMLSLNDVSTEKSLESCRKLLNRLGIYFVVYEANSNCKVRGALTTYKNHPTIYISTRGKRHTYLWFAIFHEIAHLILHYSKKDIRLFSDEDIVEKENDANTYAKNLLLVEAEYLNFIKKGDYNSASILSFAALNNIPPGFVVDFLKHDKIIGYEKKYSF